MAVTYTNAIANLVFPSTIAKKEDDGSLKNHHRLVATRFLRKAMQSDKDELVQAVIAASASRKEGAISEEDAELCLKILAAVESLLEPLGLPVPEDGKSADDLLAELGEIDRQEVSFTEDNLREHLQVSVAPDVEIPPYLEHAIGAFAWTKGAHYDRSYAEAEDDATPPDVPDIISDADADLFAALGMGDVVEAVKEAAKAGVDPLAKARQAAREADPPDRTPPGVVRPVTASGSTLVIPIPPPEPNPAWVKETARQAEAQRVRDQEIVRKVQDDRARSEYLLELIFVRVYMILDLPEDEQADPLTELLEGIVTPFSEPWNRRKVDGGEVYDLDFGDAGLASGVIRNLLAGGPRRQQAVHALGRPEDETLYLLETITDRGLDPETVDVNLLREREEAERAQLEEERRAEEARLEAERLAEEARIKAERLEAEKAAAEAAAKAAAPPPPTP